MELSVVPYRQISPEAESNGRLTGFGKMVRYRECLKNHAASIGGHANDGCGEFMPDGEEGSIDALRCAACGCHRNFHRKETSGAREWWDPRKKPVVVVGSQQHRSSTDLLSLHPPDPARESPDGCRKRYRTKFTAEQKEKMQAFAERLGWRIQKHDDVALQEFCMEIGVKRHVLKVWMHNNKHTLGKKQPAEPVAETQEPLAAL